MTMKKILMAAVAVSALTAGAASAASITAAKVSNIPLTTGSSPLNYALASSVKTSVAAALATTTTTGHNAVSSTLTTGTRLDGNPSGTTYSVTYALTGTATPVFATPVTSFILNGSGAGGSTTAACVPTGLNIVSGGAIGTSSVTGVFTVPSTCSSTVVDSYSPNGATFDVPFKISSTGTVTATMSFKIVSTDSAYDGSGAVMQLVQSASPYTVAVTADSTSTRMALGTASAPYLQLSAVTGYDNILGTVVAKVATAPTTSTGVVYPTLAANTLGALPTITSNIDINATSGTFATIVPSVGGSGTVSSANNALFTETGLTTASAANVTVSITGTNSTSISSIQTYTATITPVLSSTANISTPSGAGPTALQSISLEGVNFLVPWVAGSQTGGSSTTIRIANSGGQVNNVTLTLNSPYNSSGAPTRTTCTSTNLTKLSSVGANSELIIEPADLTTCFGAFKRGDVLVTIQGSYSNLSAKARLTTPAGQISEVSIGGLNVTNQAY